MESMKYTNQRVEILNYLKDNYSHPTVQQVYESVKKKLPRISKATVYKNLRVLVDKGMAKELNVNGVSRFEPNIGEHHHFICRKCGRIIDLESDELTRYTLGIAKKLKGVKVESATTNFIGLCEKCKGGK